MWAIVWERLFATRNITRGNYRFFFVTNYGYFLGIILHGLFIPLFYDLGIEWLAYYNTLSTTIFITAFIINRKGYHNLGLILILLEIPTHAWLAIHALGWDSGFFVYLLALIPLTFFNPMWKNSIKISIATLVTLFYLGLKNYSDSYAPQVVIDNDILQPLYLANSFAFFLVLSFLSFYYSLGARLSEQELQHSFDEAHAQARTDALTKLPNRRASSEYLHQQLERYQLTGDPFTIIIGDIDDFKQFNDRYGHDCGDVVLKTTASTIRQALRETDHLGRWGGEEFILILPQTGKDIARELTERICEILSQTPCRFNGRHYRITMTFGICTYAKHQSLEQCLQEADMALYQGKQQGKNRVVSFLNDRMVFEKSP